MENISLKLEKEFLKAIEAVMKKHNYMTRTEFIREAIREKVKKLEEKESSALSHSHSAAAATERKEFPSYI
ncbi:MAG: ribbon-helix-helix domain-containing protein [Nanoarchaeota archaeon]